MKQGPSEPPSRYRFGPFVLDETTGRLLRDGADVPLAPREYDVLRYLVQRPGRLVTKDELLERVWGRIHITEGVIKTAVSALRAALGDDPRTPRWIETVQRRGYRFVGADPEVPADAASSGTSAQGGTEAPAPAGPAGDAYELIGRAASLSRLVAAARDAQAGRRRTVLVAGEPGMGKSALVDRFLGERSDSLAAVGACIEQSGVGEPYLPVLDVLDGWCRQDATIVQALRRYAPTWLVQLPWLTAPEERAALDRDAFGSTRDRMLREMTVLLEQVAAVRPVTMVLEDLHWSDAATVQLLDALARRRAPARLLIVATFRPTALFLSDHPLMPVRREWRLHRLCEEIVLEGLTREDVARLVTRRLGAHALDGPWIDALHEHTEGLPLFVGSVLDALIEDGTLSRRASGPWTASDPEGAVARRLPLPRRLADMLENQIARLPGEVRTLLQAASLAARGGFDAIAVADALQRDPDDVLKTLDGLARRQVWIRSTPDATGGDEGGTRYAFRHALFRHAFEERVGAASRVRLHARLADALERRRPGRPELALQIARHAREARQPARAAAHLADAAMTAMNRFDATAALELADSGLALLRDDRTDDPGTGARLMAIRLRVLMNTLGYSTPGTVEAVEDALGRVEPMPLDATTIAVWHAAWWCRSSGGRTDSAAALASRLVLRAVEADRPIVSAVAHQLHGITAMRAGRIPEAVDGLERSLGAYERFGTEDLDARFVQDPEIDLLAYLALAADLTGRPDRADAVRGVLHARLEAGVDPLSEAIALWFLALMHHHRGDASAVLEVTARAARLHDERGVLPRAPHRMPRGWAQAALGDRAGAALAAEGLADYVAEGSRLSLTALRAATAEALWRSGDTEGALAELRVARLDASSDPYLLFRPELLRVQGVLRIAEGGTAAQAERDWLDAIAMAREQGAPLLELRAATDLADALARSGRSRDAARTLDAALGPFADATFPAAVHACRLRARLEA